ncbi:hypothetical protein TSAR_012326 [Trichomalopsis sarcophagae]|uniref:E3 SUMO-protein ligase RanBP2 n=1 Tax=Trichomalopsis sarcophagae TaxID=543379 RepID=A0A232FG53_9HYME|nr:hypothetical protein TSAR_012326 [Trichomalopsis sarcophagae]
MLRTKKEVDRHVQDIFRKLQDETERTLRCYKIAELYYNVGDYESARRYLSRYVEFRTEPKGHKLMGQILEALGQKEAAVVQYKRAFELEPRQEELILKVCELLADPEVGIDVNRAKYWVDRADKLFPPHKSVFQLKEKILSIERPTNNQEDLENLITAELATRPTDVHLRVKLIKHYMERSKLDEAYKHATDIEASSIHRDSVIWYQVLCELFLKCKYNHQTMWSFWISYISALERYAALSLKEQGSSVRKTSEAIQAVYNFDQHLFEAKGQSFSSYPSLTESIFVHMWGQLHFHLACLLIQNTQREQGSWSEAGRLCAPLLLTAMHVKPIDLTASWATHLEAPLKNQLQIWYREGSYRCSQAGHVLHDYARGNQKKLISNIEKFCSGSWRERVYQRIFVGKIYQKIRSSYFTNNNATTPPFRLVSHNELKRFDEVAEEVWPYSLHHQVWPAIKSRNSNSNSSSLHSSRYEGPQPNLTSHLFPDLQFSVYNLGQASPVTLSHLDVDAFLNAAALCATAVVEEQQRNTLWNSDRLPTLPADLTNPLCSDEQEKWWRAAYKMYRKEAIDDIGDTRQCLQRGLEVVRCIGNHGLHSSVLVHLARIFHYRAKQLKEKNRESSDIPALEARSEMYWSAAVPLLERLQNNQAIRSSHVKLFDYIGKDMNNMELTHAIEEGKILLAQKLVRDKLYEQAIEALRALKCPEASFEQGKIYKKMADETMSNLPKESVTSEMRSQHIIILSKARNCFYLTLDRLRSPDTDPKHPLNSELGTHITAVENELRRIDPDTLYADRNRNDCDDLSEESYSSAHSDEHPLVTNSLPVMNNSFQTPMRSIRRTPRQSSTPRHQNQDMLDVSRNRNEARPSPERLDAQIRQLVHSVESLTEQNQEQHRDIKMIISKLDELDIKINYANYSSTSLPTPAANRTSALVQNLFAAQRHPYSPLVYPPPAAAGALPGYCSSNGLPYDAATAAAVAAAGQHLPGFYSAVAAAYPIPSPYRGALDSISQMQENVLQHGIFGQRLGGQLPDYTANQHIAPPQQQQLPNQVRPSPNQLGHQMLQELRPAQVNDPAKNEPKLGYAPPSEPSVSEPPYSVQPKDASNVSSTTTSAGSRNALPANVVMTTSDTLPTTVPSIHPTFSVTIPAQHRLGVSPSSAANQQPHQQFQGNEQVPHSYQISMPSQPTIPTTVNLPPLSATLTISSPIIKPQDNQNSSLLSTGSRHSSSDVTEVEHDPIPDFAPIIPLPDEVPVTTGEENEEELYCARAKLFRFVDKEWKERGIGNVKLLKNTEGKIRLLMRREQVLKICANHMLRKDMELTMMKNNEKAYIWVANDFADEELRLEKLCIKFKTVEEAASFKENFEKAKDSLPDEEAKPATETKTASSGTDKSSNKPTKPDTVPSNKPVEKIGGFSFTSSPIIQKAPSTADTPEQKKPEEQAKPSPFASFSFVKSSEPAAAAAAAAATKTPTTGGFSFGSPATPGTQTPIFGQDLSKATLRRPLAAGPTDLSKGSEVSRIEDGEIVIAEQNINLMHYTSDNKLWKEKGIGIIKVLFEKSTGRVRLLMNTEDNSKTIYNQIVPPRTVFNLKSDTVNWTIENEKNKPDSYLARFKNYDQASLFQKSLMGYLEKSAKLASSNKSTSSSSSSQQKPLSEMFKPAAGSWECKGCYMRNSASAKSCVACQAPSPSTDAAVAAPAARPTIQTVSKNLFDQFKPAAGSWECKDCYTRNDAGVTKCVACQAAAPGQPATEIPAPAVTTSTTSKPLSELFKPAAGSWECKQCYVVNSQSNQYCAACDKAKDPSMPPKPKTTGGFLINSQAPDTKPTFSFGIPQAAQPAAAKPSAGFTFNFATKPASENAVSSPINIFANNKSPNSSFQFGMQPPSTPPSSGGGNFTFGSPGKSFDFQFQAKSPPVKSPERHETSDEDVVEEAEDVYFAPVIPLPDKIEVKTGEENEDVLYSHRAKLFKFDSATKEWKERGLGDIKLLRHVETKKLRLVMRRDQVLKLCLNHAVTPALEISSKDDKTWMWTAGDYSEGEIEYMQFACRFKTPEIAADFKNAVDNACSGVENTSTVSTSAVSSITTATKKDSSPDIEVVYEIKVTPEEKAAALKLKLPENFYSYKYKSDCPGCRGCKDSDESLFKNDKTKAHQPSVQAKPNAPIFVKANDSAPVSASASAFGNIFTKPATTTASITQPGSGLKMAFGTSTPPIFGGGKSTLGDDNTAKSTSFVFGLSSPIISSVKPDSQGSTGLENLKICEPTAKPQVSSTTTATTTANIFGGFGGSSTTAASTKPPSTSIFSPPAKNIFGESKPVFGESKPIFGDSKLAFGESKPLTMSSGIFGESKPPTANIFGGTAAPPAAVTTTTTSSTTNSIFGTTTTITSLFGGTASTLPSFGALANQGNTTANGGLFSSNTFGSTTPALDAKSTTVSAPASTTTTTTVGSTIFGGNAATQFTSKLTFGTGVAPTTNVFGNLSSGTSNIFGGSKPSIGDSESKKESAVNFLPTENSLSFSTLAQNVPAEQKPAFKTDPNFTFEGAGASVFGVKNAQKTGDKTKKTPNSKKDKAKDDDDEDGDDENENGDEHDPYFEPIIPLPDAIEVRTGEEDEEKVFCHRAKLYRYDNNTKEWKERGTGEMKLLHHAEHGTYRLLLRREQVHKVVCNLLLTSDLEFRELNSSDRAWMWAGMNYAEADSPEVEQLAVRFKTPELASQFKEAVDKAQQALAEKQMQDIQNAAYDSGEEDYPAGGEYDEDEEEENDEEEDEEDEDQVTMFEKRATVYAQNEGEVSWKHVAMGNLKVLYDSSFFGVKIVVENDNNELASETVISVDTTMQYNEKECTWAAIDYAVEPQVRRTLRAVFSSSQTAEQMYQTFQEGLECATKADIRE